MRTCLLLACVAALMPAPVRADEVHLKNGGRLSGRILSRTSTSIEVDVGAGTVTVSMSSVVRVEEQRTPIHEYHDRAGRLAAGDAAGWVQLATWASGQGLNSQARAAYRQALAADPDNPVANTALGRVRIDGRWVSEAESYRLRGYVPFEGGWLTPAERDNILERRDAEHAAEMARLDALRQVREAEARAAEAEARARAAEAAQPQYYTVPFWWGSWGPSNRPPHRKGTRPPPETPRPWPPLGMFPSFPIGVWPAERSGFWPSAFGGTSAGKPAATPRGPQRSTPPSPRSAPAPRPVPGRTPPS